MITWMFLLLLAYLADPLTAQASCPQMTCNTIIGDQNCYANSGTNPVTSINLYPCASQYWCGLDTGVTFAWAFAYYQQFSSGTYLDSGVYKM